MWVFTVLTPIMQLLGDLGDRPAAGERLQDLPLPRRQGRPRGLGPEPDLARQPAGERARDHRLPASHLQHRLDDLGPPGVLRQVAGRSLLQRLEHPAALGVGRQQQHARRELVADDGAHDGQPVEGGHLVVDQRDIGPLGTDRLERLPSVLGLGHHLDSTVAQPAPG